MPALKPTDFFARITWLGQVTGTGKSIRSVPAEALDLDFSGVPADRHAGLTRPSCSRVTSQHPRGTEIRNARQISMVSAEEMAEIAARMELDRLAPEWLGATVIVEGLPDFSHVPPSSRLQGPDGVTVVVDMENRPCSLPAREIEADHPGLGKRFKSAAQGRRGVTVWVERPGRLALGDVLRLHIPHQPVWACLDEARRD